MHKEFKSACFQVVKRTIPCRFSQSTSMLWEWKPAQLQEHFSNNRYEKHDSLPLPCYSSQVAVEYSNRWELLPSEPYSLDGVNLGEFLS